MCQSYHKDPKKWFGRTDNRNKTILQEFQSKIENFTPSPEVRKYKRFYQSKTPYKVF